MTRRDDETEDATTERGGKLRTLELKGSNRVVGYRISEAKDPIHRVTAIVLFYPLSGSSTLIEHLDVALDDYKCSVLCVDRPGVASTSELPASKGDVPKDVHRIQGHAEEVIAVLQHLQIKQVYLLGVCLGHPFAVQVASRLCEQENATAHSQQSQQSQPPLNPPSIDVKGLTLMAPFVSPACPEAWKVARFGSYFPSWVVMGVVHMLHGSSSLIMPMFLSPSKIQSMFHQDELQIGGWTDADFEELCEMAIEGASGDHAARSIDAWLGTSPDWQFQVCDRFSKQFGLGPRTNANDHGDEESPSLPFPIRIHASKHDQLATWESVQWLAKRCYGWDGNTIIDNGRAAEMEPTQPHYKAQLLLESDFHSHEALTIFGGPFRNPVLLHKIAADWGLV